MGTSISKVSRKTIPSVDTFAELPDSTSYVGQLFWVNSSTGTAWLPGSMGGSYRPKGLYYSTGADWEWRKSPYQATLAEVNVGDDDSKFVTPSTLQNSDLATKFKWTFDLTEELSTIIYAPRDIIIDSVDEELGTAVVTIEVNNSPYTLGDTILKWDEIKVSSDINTVLNLNITKL